MTPTGRRLVRILIFLVTLIGGAIGLFMGGNALMEWLGIPS
jgi:hypothetical protein